MGSEYDIIGKNPSAEATIKNIGQYRTLMEDLRNALSPEIELIDSRVVLPAKDLTEIVKKIRKTITKRDHKVSRTEHGQREACSPADMISSVCVCVRQLVDYDRHNNSLNKLRDKKEKSLSDEKNLFKVRRRASWQS
jgi:amphiphysin